MNGWVSRMACTLCVFSGALVATVSASPVTVEEPSWHLAAVMPPGYGPESIHIKDAAAVQLFEALTGTLPSFGMETDSLPAAFERPGHGFTLFWFGSPFGQIATPSASQLSFAGNPVIVNPEPATVGLFGTGLLITRLRLRRRR